MRQRLLRLAACSSGVLRPRSLRFSVPAKSFGPQKSLYSTRGPTKPVELRPYQEECIQAVIASLGQGQKRLGVSLATGSGKTVIFTHLINRVEPRSESATRTLILVHRRELAEQAARHCKDAYPNLSVEIEMGNLHASGLADITIASVQSIVRDDTRLDCAGVKRLDKYLRKNFKLILVDEAHHIVAPGYLEVLDHFNLTKSKLNSESPALVGVSATFSRFDGLKLGAAIDQIVYHRDYVDMIGEKWLSDVIFTTVESKADISEVRNNAYGDFKTSDLSRVVNTPLTNDLTVRAWLERASTRRSTLVFCVDVDHITGLTEAFRKRGIHAEFITGMTNKALRGELLDDFRDGKFPVLVNCGVFTEGTDIPNIDCILLARPTKSRNLLVQMIGRGMRLSPGKENCHIIDMVASLRDGVITSPTLFGLDPSELLDKAGLKEIEALKAQKESDGRAQKRAGSHEGRSQSSNELGNARITFTDYDSIQDLIGDASSERHIRAISQLAWVGVGRGRHILTTNKLGDYLTLEQLDDGSYSIKETLSLRRLSLKKWTSPFARPREVAKANTFENAVHAADTYAQDGAEEAVWTFMSLNQAWRRAPATDGQVDFLNKKLGDDPKLTSADITKGKAADMITKMKHGALGQFRRQQTLRRTEERAAEMKQRETVQVGPLAE